MLDWAKGLFSSQAESKHSQEHPIKDQTDKIIEETETTSPFPNKDWIMETPRQSASDQLNAIDERHSTSTKKSKKNRKRDKKMGGSASVLQREYQIAGSQESPEDLGASELNPATSPTPISEERSKLGVENGAENEELPSEAGAANMSAKKEKRKRQRSNKDTHAEDQSANGQATGLESYPSEQIGEPEELLELSKTKQLKSKRKRKNRKSHQEELHTGDQDHAPIEPPGTAQFADAEPQEHDFEMQQDHIAEEDTTNLLDSKKKKKGKKSSLVDQSTAEQRIRKKKSKSERAITLEVAASDEEAQEEDQVAQSIEESNPIKNANDYQGEQFHLPRSNTGKRKKLQQLTEETVIRDPDTENYLSDKPTLPQPKTKTKKYVAKPKTPKVNRTEAGDANSAALLNQFISARKNPRPESDSEVPSAKALGKRPAHDESVEHHSKKRKQIDTDPRNGDIRLMFSDDASQQHVGSSSAASKTSQRTRPSASNVEVVISSPAVKTSRSANEEIAGWTGADRRSLSVGNNQESSDDESEYEEQSGEASVTRRKRYLPVDEPSLVALETPKSGTKSKKHKQPKSEKSSSKKVTKGKKEASSGVKPKRSRSQSLATPREGNGRLDEDETTRIADGVELYRVENDLEQETVNSIIQGNAITDGKKFWDFMKDVVPDVPKRTLQSWCRRNFHNFTARGVWSTEQDEELMELFNKMPKKWARIGAELNRLPDDCRDRWRNYLSVTNLELGPWKLEEEQQLKDAVKKCIEGTREDRRLAGLLKPEEEDDDTYHEHDINWMKVSALMDLSRSHLQCYRKWKSIKAREHATTDDLVAERIVIRNSWKNLKSHQQASKTLAAEKLQFLKAIRDSKVGVESKIDWRAIDEQLDRNHEAMEMRICLRGLLQNIVGNTDKPLQENVQLLIEAFEESAPHEPEGYVDLPFESTGPKKITKRSKTSTSHDVGGSSSKPKMRHRMLKQDESQENHSSPVNANDGGLSDTIQVLDSAKKAKRPAPSKRAAKTFALSTERVMDSDSDDGAPTSAQKPQSEDEYDGAPTSAQKPQAENSSDEEQERQSESDSNLDPDVEMADVQDNEDAEEMAIDNSAYNHPPIESDDDSEMQDPDEPQVPGTPEYELQEENSGMREQSADVDESGQVYEMGEGENEEGQYQVEDDEESIMDDMSDIPARVVKKKAPGVNGEGDVYFGREASVDLDQ